MGKRLALVYVEPVQEVLVVDGSEAVGADRDVANGQLYLLLGYAREDLEDLHQLVFSNGIVLGL